MFFPLSLIRSIPRHLTFSFCLVDYGDKWDLIVDKQHGDIVPIYDRPAFLNESGFETSPKNMLEQDDLVLLLYSGRYNFCTT